MTAVLEELIQVLSRRRQELWPAPNVVHAGNWWDCHPDDDPGTACGFADYLKQEQPR